MRTLSDTAVNYTNATHECAVSYQTGRGEVTNNVVVRFGVISQERGGGSGVRIFF